MRRTVLAVALTAALLLAACGGDDQGGDAGGTTAAGGGDTTEAPAGEATTHRVPDDFPTIQGAVDAAAPGDLILVGPGTYNEAVDVTTDNLTIRGLDRNTVVLDGQFTLENGVRVLGAKGVTVENMTAHSYTGNGFFWTGVEGYHGSYLTAYRNGDYGIYAFDSVKGQLDNSYASGSPDAGFYIGQCYPCDAVVDKVVAEHNGLGYSGTNSGGNLVIVNSEFRNNRAGIVPNSGSYELCYPERETTIVGNIVHDNNQADSPAIDVALLGMWNGILVAGGVNNVIERNLVYNHERTGIGLVPFLEEDPNDDIPPDSDLARTCAEAKNDPVPTSVPGSVIWDSKGNTVEGNVVSDSGIGDIALATLAEDPSTLGNCFSGNTFTTSAPANLEQLAPCEGTGTGDWKAGAIDLVELITSERPPAGDYTTTPVPPAQESMPDAETAPPHPATDVPVTIDLDAITVPEPPAG